MQEPLFSHEIIYETVHINGDLSGQIEGTGGDGHGTRKKRLYFIGLYDDVYGKLLHYPTGYLILPHSVKGRWD